MTFPQRGRQGRLLVEETDVDFWPADGQLPGEIVRLRWKQASGFAGLCRVVQS